MYVDDVWPLLAIFFKYKSNGLHVGPDEHYYAHNCILFKSASISSYFYAGLREYDKVNGGICTTRSEQMQRLASQ